MIVVFIIFFSEQKNFVRRKVLKVFISYLVVCCVIVCCCWLFVEIFELFCESNTSNQKIFAVSHCDISLFTSVFTTVYVQNEKSV